MPGPEYTTSRGGKGEFPAGAPLAPKRAETQVPNQTSQERLARLEGEVEALKQLSEPGKAAPSKEPVLYTQALAKLIDAVVLYLGFGEGAIDPETAGLIVLVIEALAVVVSRKAVTPNAKLPHEAGS